MNKVFLYGIVTATVVLSVYKGGTMLLSKKDPLEDTETSLSLLEINFLREAAAATALPTATLTKHDGDKTESFTLESLKGKPIIVHIWATWCGPCVKELPHYDAFVKDHPEISHVALTPDGTTVDNIKTFFKQKSLVNMPVLTDEKGVVSRTFGVKAYPTTILINKDGKVLGRVTGPVDWQDKRVCDLILKTLG
jgi:thiol-disulfide isomerase/thioredoxin